MEMVDFMIISVWSDATSGDVVVKSSTLYELRWCVDLLISFERHFDLFGSASTFFVATIQYDELSER